MCDAAVQCTRILHSFKAMGNMWHYMVLRQQTECEASNLHGNEVNYCHRENNIAAIFDFFNFIAKLGCGLLTAINVNKIK